jgi:thymidine kinase
MPVNAIFSIYGHSLKALTQQLILSLRNLLTVSINRLYCTFPIGIDEGQFFPDIVEFSEKMANLGKTVMVAALDGTFQRKGFASVLELVPLAEHVVKLTAVCMNCFGEGSYTKRISADKEV